MAARKKSVRPRRQVSPKPELTPEQKLEEMFEEAERAADSVVDYWDDLKACLESDRWSDARDQLQSIISDAEHAVDLLNDALQSQQIMQLELYIKELRLQQTTLAQDLNHSESKLKNILSPKKKK